MPSGKKKRASGINKKDLTEKLALNGGIPKIRAAEYIDILTGIISEALLDGKKVTISDFGTFNLSERSAFHGYDPRNEKRIHVPRRVIPVFRAGKQLKNALNLPLIRGCTLIGPNKVEVTFSKLLDPNHDDILKKGSYEVLLGSSDVCTIMNVQSATSTEVRKVTEGKIEVQGIQSVQLTTKQPLYDTEFKIKIRSQFRDIDGNHNHQAMHWPRR